MVGEKIVGEVLSIGLKPGRLAALVNSTRLDEVTSKMRANLTGRGYVATLYAVFRWDVEGGFEYLAE